MTLHEYKKGGDRWKYEVTGRYTTFEIPMKFLAIGSAYDEQVPLSINTWMSWERDPDGAIEFVSIRNDDGTATISYADTSNFRSDVTSAGSGGPPLANRNFRPDKLKKGEEVHDAGGEGITFAEQREMATKAYKRHRAIRLNGPEEAEYSFAMDTIKAMQSGDQIGVLPDDPKALLRHILYHSPEIAREVVLDQVEIMLVRGMSINTVAETFGVSTRTVKAWRKDLRQRRSDEFGDLSKQSAYEIVGKDLALFDLRHKLGMQMATAQGSTWQQRIRGLQVAEAAHNNKIAFMEKLGYFDKPLVTPDTGEAEDRHVADAKLLTDGATEILGAVFKALDALEDFGEAVEFAPDPPS